MDYEAAWNELKLKIINGASELENLKEEEYIRMLDNGKYHSENDKEYMRLKAKRSGVTLVESWMNDIEKAIK
jgi:hypothetical protein